MALLVFTREGEYEGRLATFLPPDADAALRCEGIGLAEQRIVKLLGGGDAAEDVLGGREMASAVLGREVITSIRDGDLLVLTRLSQPGRTLVDAALAARGARVPDSAWDLRSFEVSKGTNWFVARDRDVLVAGTSEAIACDALERGANRTPAADGPVHAALGDARPVAGRVEAWSRGDFADEWLGVLLEGGPASIVLEALALDDARAVAAVVEMDERGARLTWRTERGGVPRDETSPAIAVDAAPAEDLIAIARSLAPPDEAMIVAGARIGADEVVCRFLDAVPDDLRAPGAEVAAESLACVTHDGAAIVLARLRETDGLDVESAAANAPEVVAGAIVALRLRGPRPAAIAALEASLRAAPDVEPRRRELGRASIVSFPAPEGGDPRSPLVSPAGAVLDDLLILATHEALLERALAAREIPDAVPPVDFSGTVLVDFPGTVLAVNFRGPQLHEFALDVRGNVGRAARHRPSASLRRAVQLHLRAGGAEAGPALDAETARLESERDAAAFRDAVAAHRARWAALSELVSVDVTVRVDGDAFVVEADARIR